MPVEITHEPPADWRRLVGSDPAADYFHLPAWLDTVAAHTAGARPVWMVSRRDSRPAGGLAALVGRGRLRRRVESGAHGCAGGVLVGAEEEPDTAAAICTELCDALVAVRGGGLATASMNLNPAHEERWRGVLAGNRHFRRLDSATQVVDLAGGLDAVADRMAKNKRNERNRSLNRGVQVGVSRDPDDLVAYHALHAAAARIWGQPPTPLALLQALLAADGRDGTSAWFVCVRHEGRVIGGHLNLAYGDAVTAWHGVTDPASARTLFPATTAIWGDLVEACARGARWLDLGGSNGVASLESFKASFGARTRVRGWYLAEAGPLRMLRAGRDRWRARRPGTGRRWHDGEPGARGPGS